MVVGLAATRVGVATAAAVRPAASPPSSGQVNPFVNIDTAAPCMQEKYWGTGPTTGGVCYGCGPANPDGLRLRSYISHETHAPTTGGGDAAGAVAWSIESVARFEPKPHHHAFPNVLNGGVIATLLDCHANILASYFLMRARQGPDAQHLPALTVTATFEMALKRPTPMDGPVFVWATVDAAASDAQRGHVFIDAKLFGADAASAASLADAKPTATSRGRFVAPKPKL